MCRVSRRKVLFGSAALLSLKNSDWELLESLKVDVAATDAAPQVGKVDQVSDGIYFHQCRQAARSNDKLHPALPAGLTDTLRGGRDGTGQHGQRPG